MRTIAWVSIVAAVTASAGPSRADGDKALAEATFEQGRQLLKDGKLGQACAKFEASYRADAALGTLLNLGDCHAKLGRTATAWAEFHEAGEMAHLRGDTREDAARKHALALEPKLDRIRIDPPQTDIPGLIVKRDGADATGTIGAEVPVDPGEHEVEVSAPGYQPWTMTLTVKGEGSTASVDVPSLIKIGGPAPEPAPIDAKPAAAAADAKAAAAAKQLAADDARRAAEADAKKRAAQAALIAQARGDWRKAEESAEQAANSAREAADVAAMKARALRVMLFRSWTPPKRASTEDGVTRHAIDARVAALYGRCSEAQDLVNLVRNADDDYFTAVLMPDPLIAWCSDH